MLKDSLYYNFHHWCKRGSIWITSDTHFQDEQLEEAIPNRIKTADHIKLINSKVTKNDTLIILGDVGCLKATSRLNGYKVLVAGNHDTGLSKYQKQIHYAKFDSDTYDKYEALDEMKELYPNCKYDIRLGSIYSLLHSSPILWNVTANNGLFDEIYSGPLIIGKKIVLSHEKLNNINWAFNIHGHIHNPHIPNDNNHFNVCGDARRNYEPINLNSLIKSGIMREIEDIHTLIRKERLKS